MCEVWNFLALILKFQMSPLEKGISRKSDSYKGNVVDHSDHVAELVSNFLLRFRHVITGDGGHFKKNAMGFPSQCSQK